MSELFKDFKELEEAFVNDNISLEMYLNEYNRMIKKESDRYMRIEPPASERENT